MKISESGGTLGLEETTSLNNGSTGGSQVNHYIQQLALRYCGDCKNSFEELSKIIQKVMATRKELVTFDANRKTSASALGANIVYSSDEPASLSTLSKSSSS